MTGPSSDEIATAVEALASHIREEVSVKFAAVANYLMARGIPIEGDEELTGEHVNQPHVGEYTTLLGTVSREYVQIVEALFKSRPVMLEVGDPALFATGDEPWWVTWSGHRDALLDGEALVDAAIELVHE